MQKSLCFSRQESLKNAKKCDANEGECEHSYCQIRKQKKETGCLDFPPKGLPWSTGLLKYIPGQRNCYTDLYLKQLIELEATKFEKQSCPPSRKSSTRQKAENNQNNCQQDKATYTCCCCPTDGNSKKKKKKKKKSKTKNGKNGGCMICSCVPDSNNNSEVADSSPDQCPTPGPCCIEFEEVLVCDGSSEPRKGFIFRPCQRPEATEAAEMASEAMNNTEQSDSNPGMICLCVPRSYLKRNNGDVQNTEDLCAKFGVQENTNSNGQVDGQNNEQDKEIKPDEEGQEE